MSSVQTGQLISLLVNNVLMVMIVVAIATVAWLRWHWLRATGGRNRTRRCRWAYLSFVLTVATLLGMLSSLGMLSLRAIVAINALVTGAMGVFLLSVITLLLALGLWFIDLSSEPSAVGQPRDNDLMSTRPVALLSASMMVSTRRSKRMQRRQRR